jgi:hypothetical protein
MSFQRFDDCDDAYSQAPGGVRFVESHKGMNYEFLEAALVRERTRQFRLMILVSEGFCLVLGGSSCTASDCRGSCHSRRGEVLEDSSCFGPKTLAFERLVP